MDAEFYQHNICFSKMQIVCEILSYKQIYIMVMSVSLTKRWRT